MATYMAEQTAEQMVAQTAAAQVVAVEVKGARLVVATADTEEAVEMAARRAGLMEPLATRRSNARSRSRVLHTHIQRCSSQSLPDSRHHGCRRTLGTGLPYSRIQSSSLDLRS